MRLIDADALIAWIDVGHLRHPSELCFSEIDVVNMLNHAPTIEPERKKGKWIKGGEQPYFRKHFDIVVCSKCNKRGEHRWSFCPNCGADMRGEKE